MSPINPDNQFQVLLRPVTSENWREVARLQVTQSQREFVAEPSYYLAMCCYGNDWHPLAIYLGEQVIGFMMWAVDPADDSCWFGGFTIDQSCQRKGYGRQALQAAITMFVKEYGYKNFALSYQPKNEIAKHLYISLGFSETDEWDEDEIIARISIAG